MSKSRSEAGYRTRVTLVPILWSIATDASSYDDRKGLARVNGLSMAAYARQAILQRIRQDSEDGAGK